MSFVPTIERRTPGPNSTIFLCKSPLEMGLSGQFTDVPYILGINKYEAGVGNALCKFPISPPLSKNKNIYCMVVL